MPSKEAQTCIRMPVNHRGRRNVEWQPWTEAGCTRHARCAQGRREAEARRPRSTKEGPVNPVVSPVHSSSSKPTFCQLLKRR